YQLVHQKKITSDYIELISLIILFIIGAPLNLAAWTQISSNVIVCIALDRLLSVLSVSHRNPGQATCRMRIMLLIAWIAAAVISAPQFVVWRLFQAFDNPPWSQCMQIWEIERSQLQRNNFQIVSNDSSIKLLDSKLLDEESLYMILHMLLIFWIPACIIMLCYLLLSCWVYINSKPNFFDIINSAEKDGGGGQQIQMINLLNNQQNNHRQQITQNASNGGGMLVALRSSRVSYQLAPVNNSSITTTQGHETQNTTLFTNNINSNIESPKTKKPMIVLNDEMLLSLSPSQSPQPDSELKQNKHLNGIAEMVKQRETEQRNSSTTSNEAAAALLLASKRQRQSSSYSAKSQRLIKFRNYFSGSISKKYLNNN
uniref:G_PROTEIN_RECEP_F1_2 domain-containing protein n=1 Tax=Meloidogyne hapla TaxID=6305 RepID=A0A1I8BDQ5_MELHA